MIKKADILPNIRNFKRSQKYKTRKCHCRYDLRYHKRR